MRTQDIIAAKRDKKELANDDIFDLVFGYAKGDVPDYQMSAFLMACYLNGLTEDETVSLTMAMVKSGDMVDLSSINGVTVDKHSTGGVGDKTTFVVVPVLAACGYYVPKMSGRGLGFTGGTLDKLESIPGFNTALSLEKFISQVRDIGAAMAGQTLQIVPADKKIYALRDVTATVDCMPLIAASIMSKKIACSSDNILLDVKTGSGAFMKDLDSALKLSNIMRKIGTKLDRKIGIVISDMSQPLGFAVGNALEVKEAISTLNGQGPDDFKELCVELCAGMLYICGFSSSIDASKERAKQCISSGEALNKFLEIVKAQGGDINAVKDTNLLPSANMVHKVNSRTSGYVRTIDCEAIGVAASMLGAGRQTKEDKIDPAAGIVIKKKIADFVNEGETIAEMHTNLSEPIEIVEQKILGSYTIGEYSKCLSTIIETHY